MRIPIDGQILGNALKVGPGYTFTTEPARRFVCWRKQPMPPRAFGEFAMEWRHPFAQQVRSRSEGWMGWRCPFCDLWSDAVADPR